MAVNIGGSGVGFMPVHDGGVILVDDAGNEQHYTPEQWCYKETIEQLQSIGTALNTLIELMRKLVR